MDHAYTSRSKGRGSARLLLLVLASAVSTGTPAHADSSAPASMKATTATAAAARWALPPANVGRRSAVLGGPSQVQQILEVQQSPVMAAAAAPAMATRMVRAASDNPVPGGGPNIFGSMALAVAATPLDGQWRRSMAQGAPRQLARWTGRFAYANDPDPMQVLTDVNRWVNAHVTFVDDARAVGQVDQWAGAAETLRRASGDCEDFALAKLQLLTALGFDPDRMFLVVARDLVRRADHAVLVVMLDDRFVVLDNMTDEILDSNDVGDYRPVMSYSASGRWIHGYERPSEAPVQLASNVAP